MAKQSPASGDPARKRKIIGVVGLSLLLGIVGIFAVFYLGNGHSGWATETFKGYQIDMPAGNDRTQKSHQNPLATVYELTARRQETGSQYTILVAETPGTPADTTVEDMIRKLQILIYDEQPIRRNGVDGVSGKWSSSTMGAEASEAEVFFHNGHFIGLMYSPYSKIMFAVGGTQPLRENERELDKPEEFFASIRFE